VVRVLIEARTEPRTLMTIEPEPNPNRTPNCRVVQMRWNDLNPSSATFISKNPGCCARRNVIRSSDVPSRFKINGTGAMGPRLGPTVSQPIDKQRSGTGLSNRLPRETSEIAMGPPLGSRGRGENRARYIFEPHRWISRLPCRNFFRFFRMIGLIRTSTAVFRVRIVELGLSCGEVDFRAGLTPGHTNKILNGKKAPGAVMIEKLCGTLKLALRPEIDPN
jgi:hypothetical protein